MIISPPSAPRPKTHSYVIRFLFSYFSQNVAGIQRVYSLSSAFPTVPPAFLILPDLLIAAYVLRD